MQPTLRHKSWRPSILNTWLLLVIFSQIVFIRPGDTMSIHHLQNTSGIRANNNSAVGNMSEVWSAENLKSASVVLSKLKPEIDPCNDFYQFACGKFTEEVEIPNNEKAVNEFTVTQNNVADQLKNIITEDRPPTDPKHLRLPNDLYKACMNTSRIEALGVANVIKLSDSLGGWPLIKGDSWDANGTWSWQHTMSKLLRLGVVKEALFATSVEVAETNSSISTLIIRGPKFDIAVALLLKGFNDNTVAAYYDYMVDIAVLFGADRDKATTELREVMAFEIALANISVPLENRDPNEIRNTNTIKQLQESYPYVHWLDYINSIMPEGLLVDESEPIVLIASDFFKNLGPLLAKTPKRVIANYMMWQMHDFAVPYISEKFRKRNLQYQTTAYGVQNSAPHWKKCVDFTTERKLFEFIKQNLQCKARKKESFCKSRLTHTLSLKLIVGSLYVQKHFDETSKPIIQEMFNNIRIAFERILNEVDWMDKITKEEAKKKLHHMAAQFGYPDELLDDSKLERYYRNLKIHSNDYFKSVLSIKLFLLKASFSKLRLPVRQNNWDIMSLPTTTNSYYVHNWNSIIIPAGILRDFFFNAKRPQYMNYGSIGSLIGHEIAHGFDNFGKFFDKEGNLVDWWQPDAKKSFQNKVQCIIEQYSNYMENSTHLNVNGTNTQVENIADNGGFKESYRAYQEWARVNGPEPKLPGLNYTAEQMFWISAAQTWCLNARTGFLKEAIISHIHSPSMFRVIGSFSNLEDFSKDFQCPVGSPMNPQHKCKVW